MKAEFKAVASASKAIGRIKINKRPLKDFCQRHNIKSLALFGSVLRDDFGPDSDIDILVEFKKGQAPGFLGLAEMELELAALIGHPKVDMRTPEDLSPYFRYRVIGEAEVLYR
jgi:uncharacterized protein